MIFVEFLTKLMINGEMNFTGTTVTSQCDQLVAMAPEYLSKDCLNLQCLLSDCQAGLGLSASCCLCAVLFLATARFLPSPAPTS